MDKMVNYRVYIKKAKNIIYNQTGNFNDNYLHPKWKKGNLNTQTGNEISGDQNYIISTDYININSSHKYEILNVNGSPIICKMFEYTSDGTYKRTKNLASKSKGILNKDRSTLSLEPFQITINGAKQDCYYEYIPSSDISKIKIRIQDAVATNENDPTNFYTLTKRYAFLENTYPTLIHDSNNPDKRYHLLNPNLHLEDSSAGSFEFVLSQNNLYYENQINLWTDTVYITRIYKTKNTKGENEFVIWDGRPISAEIDIYGNRLFRCEGALSYLNDIRTRDRSLHEYTNTVANFIQNELISIHNDKTIINNRMDRSFFSYVDNNTYYGKITANTGNVTQYTWVTQYESISKWLSDIKGAYGYHYKVRYRAYSNETDDILCRDFTIIKNLSTFDLKKNEDKRYFSVINAELGINVFDAKRSSEIADYASEIIPRGAPCGSSSNISTNVFLSNESAYFSDGNGMQHFKTYYQKDTLSQYDRIKNNGMVQAVVDFESAATPKQLYNGAISWFDQNKELIKRNIEITLSNINTEIIPADSPDAYTDSEYIDIWTVVNLKIPQWGATEQYFVSSMDIPLDDWLNTTLNLVNKKDFITDGTITAGEIKGMSKGVIDKSS